MKSIMAHGPLALLVAGVFLLMPVSSHGEDVIRKMDDLEKALQNLNANTNLAEVKLAIRAARETIERGQALTNQLADRILGLEKQTAKLGEEKDALEKAQYALGTGLVATLLG